MDSPPCAMVGSFYTNTCPAARRTKNLLALSEAVKWVMENEEYAEMFDCSHPLSTKMMVHTALDVKG